ncbi:MAG: response regulator [Gammaproteobacteria bacterium]|nr:response regulator [Gammaproteobacteria bacterium]
MNATKKRILIADDDSLVLDFAQKTLGDAGFQVLTASSGEEGIEVAATYEVDLALLDFRMPGLTGLDTSRVLYELTGTRFILMSAYPDRNLVMQAANEGALEFLTKPLRRDDLLNTVTVCLARADEIKSKEDSLSRGIASARSVSMVIGLLMAQHKKTRTDAETILMRMACHQHRRAVEICEEILRKIDEEYGEAENS